MVLSDYLRPNSYMLKKTGGNEYEVRIKMPVTGDVLEEMAIIAKSTNLSLRQEIGELVIYSPK
jgi:hypothetical protein